SLLQLADPHVPRPSVLHWRAAHLDAPAQVVEELRALSVRPGRAPDLEGRVLAGDPPRDQQMAEVDRVVRVVMGDEDARPIPWTHARLDQRRADAGAAVDEKSRVAAREDRREAPPRRVGGWTSRAEQNRAHLALDTSMAARPPRP